MNNKYDFTNEEAEKLLLILYPTISAIEMNIIDLIEAMEELGLESEDVDMIKSQIDSLEFLDEFEEIKNAGDELKTGFFTRVMNVQVKDDLGNPYFVFMQFFQVDELMTTLDEFILDSQKRLKVEKLDVKPMDEFRSDVLVKAREIATDVMKLLERDNMLNIFIRQGKKIVDEADLSTVEEITFDFIISFEEYNSASEIENERFGNDKTVKLVYELINRVLALISYNNFLNEFNFDEDIVDE